MRLEIEWPYGMFQPTKRGQNIGVEFELGNRPQQCATDSRGDQLIQWLKGKPKSSHVGSLGYFRNNMKKFYIKD